MTSHPLRFLVAVVLVGCMRPADTSNDGREVFFARDPASGMCVPIDVDSGGKDTPYASWETCENPCDSLSIEECKADPRCTPTMDGCKPVLDACVGLDEKTCGATSGCQPVYGSPPCECDAMNKDCACTTDLVAVFRGCVAVIDPAPSCFSNLDCKTGSHCSVQDGDCMPPPGCKDGMSCPTVCAGVCVPDDIDPSPTCTGDDQCKAGSHCSVGDGVCRMPPDCDPSGFCPAVCYGTCVPDDGGCFFIADEQKCIASPTCEPVYVGSRCFCDEQGCGCLEYTFDECRPKDIVMPPPPPPPEMCGDLPAHRWINDGQPYPRIYQFNPDGTFAVSDLIAPCPPDGVCVWSGIIENKGKWALNSAGVVDIGWYEPVQKYDGLTFPPQLFLKDCLLVQPDGRIFK